MTDTGVAKILTARKSQFKALKDEMREIEIEITRTNEARNSLKAEYF